VFGTPKGYVYPRLRTTVLSNKKTNCEDFASYIFSVFHDLGCKMSIKMHFMFSRLDKFPENLGAISDEQGEQFHHGFMTTEVHYQDRGAHHLLSDYCCSIKCDCSIQVLASRFCIISNMFKLIV